MLSIEFWCVVSPVLGVIFGQLFKKHEHLSQFLTSSCVAISAALAWYIFFTYMHQYSVAVLPWMDVGGVSVAWSVYIDKLTSVMMIVVTTVSFVVHVYSIGYMHHDKGAVRFLSYLSMFTFFMMLLVTSGNLLQLFCGWEGVGLCSYLLIGFWFHKDSANKASMKAFIVNRVGDLFFICGILVVFYAFHTLEFREIFASIADESYVGAIDVFGHNVPVIDLACVLLFLGCMGKSAQIGLHVWLPDAMEGPTPASALIHAATMVTAGVFLVARSSVLFELSDIARGFILAVGLATCLFAAMVAIVQEDIKKIVAYSTCSQLGYMFVACGTSHYHFAVFHLLTHAFFKALLFLLAGNVIHSNDGEQKIWKMSKNCWRDLPFTYAMMWIGSLSLMGVFPFAGFFSKDLIIESSYGNTIGFIITNTVACLTAIYSCKLMLRVFHNSATKRLSSIHESTKIMLVPLIPLAVGAVFSGVLFKNCFGITESDFWDGSIVLPHEHHLHMSPFLVVLPSILGIGGALIYYVQYLSKIFSLVSVPTILRKLVQNKFYFDELYDLVFVFPMKRIAAIFWMVVDQKVVDYFILGGITGSVGKSAEYSVKIQNGNVLNYALVMLLGVVATMLFVICGFKVL